MNLRNIDLSNLRNGHIPCHYLSQNLMTFRTFQVCFTYAEYFVFLMNTYVLIFNLESRIYKKSCL